MNLHDKLLVWRFNRGDLDAVQLIYEKYKHELMAIGTAMLNDAAAAEDIVHDVFVAFLKLRNFRLRSSLKAYLATCVANGARNIIRAKSRRHHESLEAADHVLSAETGPDGQTIFGEEYGLVAGALGELPGEQREVILLRLRGGLKFAEIAESQNVSINTVQARYRYGIEKVRSKLNGEVFRCNRATQLNS